MDQSLEFKVGGMTCGNCALTITNQLSKMGAKDAVANAATGDVSFTIVEGEVPTKYLESIQKLGYTIEDKSQTEPMPNSSIKPFFIISLVFWVPLIAHMFIDWAPLHHPIVQLLLALPVYLIGVYYFGSSAWRSLKNGIPTMDVLVFIGSSAAFFYSIIGWYLHPENVHQYLFFETAASIITLVLAGNYLEEYAVKSTAGAIGELMKYQKTKAHLIFTDSIGKETIQEVDNEFVKVNDVLLVKQGEKIPVDGEVIVGNGFVDESLVSGESLPIAKTLHENVIGGTILTEGNIRMKTKAVGSNSVIAQIIKLVNQAQAAKPPMQRLADKISAVFVPLVIGIAVLTFLLNYFVFDKGLQSSMMRTIAVMVIACPCAMGLATPAAVMVGLGRAARNGILIKGGDTLEKLQELKQFVFDKTGTLTTGNLVIDCYETSLADDEFKNIVFSLENYSTHPIAKSILRAWASHVVIPLVDIKEKKGIGMAAKDQIGNEWELGSFRMMNLEDLEIRHDLYLLKNGEPVGWIDLKDELREGAVEMIESLKAKKYQLFLLSGDRKEKCDRVAKTLGIEHVFSEQLPDQKMATLSSIMENGPTAMIGDGINDAPSLARATIGISLSDASQIAMQSAQMLLLNSKLSILPKAISLGKHTFMTIRQNLFWAFFYNVAAIPIAAAGYLTPTWGAGIMALSDIVLIINSLRLRYKKLDTV